MFSQFERHPLDLTQGDIAANVARLALEADVPTDFSTRKLKNSLDKGWAPLGVAPNTFYSIAPRIPPGRVEGPLKK